MPKLLLARLFLFVVAGFVSMARGGYISEGIFSLSDTTAMATVSGEDFTASVTDDDVGPFSFNGFTPFQPSLPLNFFWGGEEHSTLVYGGADFYVPGTGLPPAAGQPYATVSFLETLVSPIPTITAPGHFPLAFTVVLSFTLFDSSHTIFHTETDTGTADGFIDYTYGSDIFVFAGPLEGIVIPEPSTFSLIGLAIFALGGFAGIRSFRNRFNR